MKKYHEARTSKLRMFAFGLFAVIALMCFASTPTIKDGAKATAITASMAMMPIGFMKMDKSGEGEGEGGASKEQVLKAVSEAAIKETQVEFKKLIAESPEFKTLKELETKMKEAKTDDELKALKAQITEIGLSIKAEKENANKRYTSSKTFGEDLFETYKSLMTPEQVKLFQSGRKVEGVGTEFKSAGTMTTSNISAASGSIPYSLVDFIPQPVDIVRRNPFVIQLINTMRTAKKIIYWVEQRNPDGGAGGTAEGSAKTEQDFDLVENSANVIKFTSYIKVSKEMLDDVPYMDNMIRKSLVDLVMLKMDTDALTGTNTTTSLNGIQNQATAWTGGTTFAASVPYANYFDVLKIGINQVATATGGDTNYSADFQANIILIHPTSLTKMLIQKDSQGRYVRDLLTYPSSNVIEIDGVRIVASTGVPVGYFYIMDSTKVNFAVREDAMISVGYENDDFTKNLVTILVETRGCLWIPNNYLGAVVYGNFTTAVASIQNSVS